MGWKFLTQVRSHSPLTGIFLIRRLKAPSGGRMFVVVTVP